VTVLSVTREINVLKEKQASRKLINCFTKKETQLLFFTQKKITLVKKTKT